MDKYVVVESTPGYLPDDDDPATFETLTDARVHARELVEQLRDHHHQVDETCTVRIDSRWSPRSWYVTRRGNDLGRVIEILELEPELEPDRP